METVLVRNRQVAITPAMIEAGYSVLDRSGRLDGEAVESDRDLVRRMLLAVSVVRS